MCLKSFNPHWLRFNCHSDKSLQANSGQRVIDVDTVPANLKIETAEIKDANLHVTWSFNSGQETTIIPVEFLINNYPEFNDLSYYKKENNFRTSNELKFFNFTNLINPDGTKNNEHVYLYAYNFVENFIYHLCSDEFRM